MDGLQIVFLLAWRLPGLLHRELVNDKVKDGRFKPKITAVKECVAAKKAQNFTDLWDLAARVASTVQT